MIPEFSIHSVGADLVRASEEWNRRAGENLADLFPYVFEASRRMSTRAISDWLKEAHGIKISQPTISRALRNPAKYWQLFAETIEPHARRVEQAVPVAMSSFMTDRRVFEWATEQPHELNDGTPEEMSVDETELQKAVTFLREHWFCLSPTTRAYMNQFFQVNDGEVGLKATTAKKK